MMKKMQIFILVLGFFIALSLLPIKVKAADKNAVIAKEQGTNSEEIYNMDIHIQEHLKSGSRDWQPQCMHNDPDNPFTLHTSMRFISRVLYYNYIELRYDIRDYYECIFCGYQTFWVHGYVYD